MTAGIKAPSAAPAPIRSNIHKPVDKLIVEVFVARQPILTRECQLYGYELLYRSGSAYNAFDGTDAASATKQVIANALLSIGMENLTAGSQAFWNFDRQLLHDRMYMNLPRDQTVVEILETVEPNSELCDLIREIRSQGYRVALDDFVWSPAFEQLIHFAQVIKIDLQATARSEQARLIAAYRPRGIALLAEKVETYEEFRWALAAGYEYFQGFFFARPSILRSRQFPAAKLNCLRLLSEMQREELDLNSLERLIRADVALTYKLLRYVNSALFGRQQEIQSILRALIILGNDSIRRWVGLATLSKLGTGKPGELIRLSIVRAQFCEQLMNMARIPRANEAFLMGMFSLLDALLDRPLGEVLESAGVGRDIVQVLCGAALPGDKLAVVYRLTREYELGDWDEVERLSRMCGLLPLEVGNAYVKAAIWADSVLRETAG